MDVALFILVIVLGVVLVAALYRIAELKSENAALRARIAPFDHDGDGRPGG